MIIKIQYYHILLILVLSTACTTPTSTDVSINQQNYTVKTEVDKLYIEKFGESQINLFINEKGIKISTEKEGAYFTILLPSILKSEFKETKTGGNLLFTHKDFLSNFYIKDANNMEWEIILEQPPSTNALVFGFEQSNIGVVFHDNNSKSFAESVGQITRDELYGGYEFFAYESIKENIRGKKLFEIHKIVLFDANQKTAVGDLLVDSEKNQLVITLPQKFLESATYPIIVDPTLGTTQANGGRQVAANTSFVGRFTMPSYNGIALTYTVQAFQNYNNPDRVWAIVYNGSSSVPDKKQFQSSSPVVISTDTIYNYTINESGLVLKKDTIYWIGIYNNATGDSVNIRTSSANNQMALGGNQTNWTGTAYALPSPSFIINYSKNVSTILADAYVTSASGTTNYGTNTQGFVYDDGFDIYWFYMLFNLSQINDSKTLSTFNLYVYQDGNIGVNNAWVGIANSNWTELGITYNNKPAIVTPLKLWIPPSEDPQILNISINVSYVQSKLSTDNITLVLYVDPSNVGGSTLRSYDYANSVFWEYYDYSYVADAGGDTCSYSGSGTYVVDCGACANISYSQNVKQNPVIFNKSGTILINATAGGRVFNYTTLTVQNSCNVRGIGGLVIG